MEHSLTLEFSTEAMGTKHSKEKVVGGGKGQKSKDETSFG